MPNRTSSRPFGNLVIALAVLLPLCFAGWLVWRSTTGSESEQSPAPELMPNPAGPSASSDGSPTDGGSPSASGESGQQKGNKDGKGKGNNGKQPDEPLHGRTVVIDPGHNPSNRLHPGKISRSVDVGTHRKACDTTGTQSNSGYAEAAFTLDLSHRIRDELRRLGATVRLTHDGGRAWGPCIDERAAIGNKEKADAAVSVHADGSGAGNRGFHVIRPAPVRAGKADTTAIVGPSERLAKALVERYGKAAGTPPANYLGDGDGLVTRDDLGGLNLSKVPKVFLECGNMRDPQDAAQLTDPKWRERAARGIADGIADFLTTKPSQEKHTSGNGT